MLESDLNIPPHSIHAEQSVLGGLLLDSNAWDNIADIVVEEDFYRLDHRLLFHTFHALKMQHKPVDLITTISQLNSIKQVEEAGGEAYIFTLAANVASVANIKAYALIVRERAIARKLITTCYEIIKQAFAAKGRDTGELLQLAEQQIFAIARENEGQGGIKKLGELLPDVMSNLDKLCHSTNHMTGIPTGFHQLDDKLCGLQPSELTILAARPSQGKTALAINIAEYVAVKAHEPVLVFSMEMASSALIMRMLSSMAHVDSMAMRNGELKDHDWLRISPAVEIMQAAPIYFDETDKCTPTDMLSRARRFVREQGKLGLIVIDYLQLMHIAGFRENRTAEISEISRCLKSMAKELKVPVLALSQLNRGVEQRADKRPVMSDLRESGAIEQDADVVMFIYRDEYYNANSMDKGQAEIIIAKQRNGPTGHVKLRYQGEYTKFDNF